MSNRKLITVASLIPLIAAGSCDVATEPRQLPIEERFTFPDGLGSWEPRVLDVFVGDEEIDWQIEWTEERSVVGTASIRFFADNRSDAAKLWIEYIFDAEPNRDYDVQVAFSFATRDWSDVNLWRIIAGALPKSPESAEDLERVFQGDTRAGPPPGDTFVWSRRTFDTAVRTQADGRIHIVVGIWGTSEFQRTYYVDDVLLVVRRL